MSTHARNDSIPEWTRGDRLRKARTIRKILLNAWVLRTGVSAESGRGRLLFAQPLTCAKL